MTPGQRDWIKKRVHEILTIPKPGIDSNSPKLIEGRAAIEGMVLAAMEPLLAGWGDSDEAEFHEGNLVMGAAAVLAMICDEISSDLANQIWGIGHIAKPGPTTLQ